MMTRIYLSGPMSGLPDENRPAFNAEATRLRALGHTVVNPAQFPGWEVSRGATIEHRLAVESGMTVVAAAEIVQ